MSWSRTVKVGSSSAKQVLRELCISQNELTGQCTLSINSLIEITELSETTVLKALATLKARGFIQVEKVKTQNGWGNSYSFPLLESTPKNEGTPNSRDTPKIKGTPSFDGEGTPNSRDTGTPKTRDLKKEEKKEKSMYAPSVEVAHTSVSSKPAKKEPQGSRLTLEELPDEWYSECRRIQPKADPNKVFEEFRDHWISQPGAKGRKSDWTATWRNWCRRINTRDLERVGYDPGRAQFMVKPEPVNPFKVTPQNCPPRQKTEEELEAERSFDLFERVLNGEV
jgi:hypothetical protein